MNLPSNPTTMDVVNKIKDLSDNKLETNLGIDNANKVLMSNAQGVIVPQNIDTLLDKAIEIKFESLTDIGAVGVWYTFSGVECVNDSSKFYFDIDGVHYNPIVAGFMLLNNRTLDNLKSSYVETLYVIQRAYIDSSLFIDNEKSKYITIDLLRLGKVIMEAKSYNGNYTIDNATLISYTQGFAINYGINVNNATVLYDANSLNGAQKLFFYGNGENDGIYYRVVGRDTIEDIRITIQGVEYNLIKFIYEFLGVNFEIIESNYTDIWNYLSQYRIDSYYNETDIIDVGIEVCGVASINFNFESNGDSTYKIKQVIGTNHLFGEAWCIDNEGMYKLYGAINDIRLNTTFSSSLPTNSNEEVINNTINLHKISKTGSYNDLLDKPTIPEPVSTQDRQKINLVIDAWDDTKSYPLDECVLYDGSAYRCNVVSSTLGSFIANEWTELDKVYPLIIENSQNISNKQDTLISGTNIKTINNESILGSGNINISGGGQSVDIVTEINSSSTDTEAPSARAVYSQILKYLCREWDSETTYSENDVVIADNIPYSCIVTTATVGTFVPEEWQDLSLQTIDVFNSLMQLRQSVQALSNRIPAISTLIDSTSTHSQVASAGSIYNQVLKYFCSEWDATKTYNSYAFVWHEGQIYVHLSDTPAQVGVFNSEEWTEASTLNIDILSMIVQINKTTESLSANKQNNLVSGTNIKTIENQSILGSGNLDLNIPTDNNQLTNGAGYITGISSTDVINALGYTPYDGVTNSANFSTIKIVRW